MSKVHPLGIRGYLPPLEDGCDISASCLLCPKPVGSCNGEGIRTCESKQQAKTIIKKRNELVCKLIAQGVKYRTIAARAHLSLRTIQRIGKTKSHELIREVYKRERNARIMRMVAAGKTYKEIANMTNLTASCIKHIVCDARHVEAQ